MVFSKVIHISGVPQQGCCAQAYQHCNPLNLKGNVELSTENVFPLLLLLSINKENRKRITLSQKSAVPFFQQHQKQKPCTKGALALNGCVQLVPPMPTHKKAKKVPSIGFCGAILRRMAPCLPILTGKAEKPEDCTAAIPVLLPARVH